MSNVEPRVTFDFRHGDCVAGMAELSPDSIDVVVTSPPYNLAVSYTAYQDDLPREDYLAWLYRWAMQIQRVLKPEGSVFLNIGATPSNPLLPHELVLRLRPLFCLQNTIHWIKSITVQPRREAELSVGHFKPLQSKRYLTDCHEYVFHLTKTGQVPIDRLAIGVEYADKSNIARWGHTGGRDLRCRGNNWFVPYETIQSRQAERPHPATFPVRLAEMCILLHGGAGRPIVLDPFLGIGNAAIAALNCSVDSFIGFEIDTGYLAEARARIADAELSGARGERRSRLAQSREQSGNETPQLI